MLAISTEDSITVIDPISLKKSFPTLPPPFPVPSSPISSSWIAGHPALLFATEDSIQKYDIASNTLSTVYEGTGIVRILAHSSTTFIFNSHDKIHILEKILSRTIETHKKPLNSLSLSIDSTLLASTSPDAAYVHNLPTGSSTALRGLAVTSSQPVTTSCFHPHTRTRLLLAVGRRLVLCDTSRPTSPSKTITLTEASRGDINFITCSPFSKTLVAVSTSAGFFSLVDLEKEKGYVYIPLLRPSSIYFFSLKAFSAL